MRARTTLVLAAVALTLAGCGSVVHPGQRIPGRKLTVYFSGPMHGASSIGAISALNAARLALRDAGGRIGRYRIVLRALDDSTLASDGWDPTQTTLDARLAVLDPTTVGYLGDFNSGASAISIPLLNRAGIPQISPGSTAVGLTSAGPGAAPGEPQKYYPTGLRTFARVVPTDASQSLALVQSERMAGCHSTFVLEDGEVDGDDLALIFALTAQSAGLRLVGVLPFKRQATSYNAFVKGVATSGADCVLISAIDERSATLLTEALAAALPNAQIFASNGLADSAYTDPSDGGIPPSLDSRVIVLSATLPPQTREARAFVADYTRKFGAPQPPAIYGYEAMQLMLAAISRATDGGRIEADRAKVRAALFSARRWSTVLGTFRVDRVDDIAVQRFGIYRIVGGRLSYLRAGG